MDSMTDDELDGKVHRHRQTARRSIRTQITGLVDVAVATAVGCYAARTIETTQRRGGGGYLWEACCPITPLQFLPPTLNLNNGAFLFRLHDNNGNGRSEGERGV